MSPTLWTPAYIAIGSNLDDPAKQVELAFDELKALSHSRLIARSRLFRSIPLGPQDQPAFINAVAGVLTQCAPRELLISLKDIEARMGRARPSVRWGPRRIDLDLLVHGDARIHEDDLTVPHPGIPVRNFVLYPLLDIAPSLLVPGLGQVSALANRVDSNGLAPVEQTTR